MIAITLALCALNLTHPDERRVAEILAASLSTPRLVLTPDAAAGLTGRAFLSVAGPPGTREVEPWLFISRLPWLFRAQGWDCRFLHNGVAAWADAREAIQEAAGHRRPVLWAWTGSQGGHAWGGTDEPPPEHDGCFVAIIGERAVEPEQTAAVVGRSVLETLSWSHAATCGGLVGLESRDDPYLAQGFGAYKRLYADMVTNDWGNNREMADVVAVWSQRRRQAAGFLRWAATRLPAHAKEFETAAVCFEQESAQCLAPLAATLSGGGGGETAGTLWQGLSWYIKGMQSLEPAAFAFAGVDSALWPLLHAPDEEPPSPADATQLLALARHGETAIRRIAFRKLVGLPLEHQDVSLLAGALRDDDALVQEAALAALEASRPPDLRVILWEAYQAREASMLHGNGSFKRPLVLALTRVRESEVPGLLAQAGSACVAGDCMPRAVPTWCADGIVGLFGQASWPYLQVMLHAPCPFSREAAAIALGRLGLRETQDELHAIAFRDSSLEVQCAALGALGRMGSTEAIGRLLDVVGSVDADAQAAAAAGLVESGEAAIPLITQRLQHADPEIARILRTVLATPRGSQARNLLIK